MEFAVEGALDVLVGGLAEGDQVGVEAGQPEHGPDGDHVDQTFEI